jgi:hypothetical protein
MLNWFFPTSTKVVEDDGLTVKIKLKHYVSSLLRDTIVLFTLPSQIKLPQTLKWIILTAIARASTLLSAVAYTQT